MKQFLPVLLALSCTASAEWVEYSTQPNGDTHLYDDERIDRSDAHVDVWTRIRYKTSVMAASSYEGLVRLDCAQRTETVLQHTFFIDRKWARPAMATNTTVKASQSIKGGSAAEVLIELVC